MARAGTPHPLTSYALAVQGGAEGHYAISGDLYIRYDVIGDGPIDLLAFSNGSSVWVDRDDEPHWSRFDRRLAAFARLVRFDPSGVGLSDPLSSGEMPSFELWAQDAVAVLDAVGSSADRAVRRRTGRDRRDAPERDVSGNGLGPRAHAQLESADPR